MDEAMQMSVSPIVDKKGKKYVYVQFSDGRRNAEARIPDCKVITNNGFEEKEIAALELYLKSEQISIIKTAKQVNAMKAFMNTEKNNKK